MAEFFSPISFAGPGIASPVSRGLSLPSFSGIGKLVSGGISSISNLVKSMSSIMPTVTSIASIVSPSAGRITSMATSALGAGTTLSKLIPSISKITTMGTTSGVSFGQLTPTELAAANARNGIGGVYFGQLTPMQLGYQNAIRDISIGIDDIIPPITLPPGIGIGTGGRGGVGVGGAGVGGAGTGTGTGASAGAKGLSSTAAKLMADQIANATSSTASGVGTPNQVPTPTFLEAFPNINLNLPNTSSDIFQKLSTIAMGMIPLLSGTNDVYQRAYNWEILLPGISVIMPQTIGKFVQGVSFGEYNMNDVAKMRYGAETRGHAGVMDIPKVTLKMLKPVPDLVYTYLMMWKTFIVDAAGFYFPKSNYALTGYVLMFDTAGNTVGTYKLINMFPTSFPAHNLSYGDDNVMSYEIEFNVDRIEYI